MSGIINDKLYTYGFLMTTQSDVSEKEIDIDWYKWNYQKVDKFHLYTHPLQNVYSCSNGEITFLLVGHAYNPFTMEKDENEILKHLSNLYRSDTIAYREYFDQITGLFFYAVIENGKTTVTCDASGMLATYYAEIKGNLYFSAYSQLIADLCGLEESEYVRRLKKSKFFVLYGWYLPGDATSYDEVYRVIPNTEVIYNNGFSCNRFYPRAGYSIDEKDYEARIKQIGDIMRNNMEIISQKWNSPAISLTGGMDSQTTLACTSDLQDRFKYFSYISLDREATDANAAHSICEAKGLNHVIYNIETDKSKLEDFDELDALIERHYSYLGKAKENDICKRISLATVVDFDVEVKSWVSEVARASRYKMYGKKKMPKKVTPRHLTSMYKVFTFNRKDAISTDKKFREYMDKTNFIGSILGNNYPWSEFFVWEIVFGGWGSLALVGEHMTTNNITVPYNNRALLDMMLRTPLNKRITDEFNKDIIRTMDKELYDMHVHVVNGNSTKTREIGEKIYFELHSRFPW